MQRKTMILLVLVLGITGCASSGSSVLKSENKATIQEKIRVGVTTKKEIQTMFGAPLSTGLTEHGLLIWKYVFAKMHADAISYVPIIGLFAGGSTGIKKELTILFDKQDRVKHFDMMTVPVNTKTGLASD